ncbi:hypothetical protein PV11_04871 [Exophiala sideris]|uniref:Uncharacterized protein n=1 Tax=Exophiala sideris TaxID=1016849 RepID=A0A0D1YIT1_9EURO|nr:hypothetical protein PV11_04871 [Exophiala sideris]
MSSENKRTHPLFRLPLEHPDHPWTMRGYREDLANSPASAHDDPLGEIAYQRAFAEVAAEDPGRVPCPSFFPKSPTARAFTEWKDSVLFSSRSANEESKPGHQPHTPTASSSATHQTLPSPRYNEEAPFPAHRVNGGSYSKTNSGSSTPSLRRGSVVSPGEFKTTAGQDVPMIDVPRIGIPMTMEPRLNAPTGPSRMLR